VRDTAVGRREGGDCSRLGTSHNPLFTSSLSRYQDLMGDEPTTSLSMAGFLFSNLAVAVPDVES